MKQSKILFWLTVLILLLASGAAAVGLFWQSGGSAFSFTSLRGISSQIYGRGVYHFDTIFTAGSFIGTDAVTLFLSIPLLAAALVLYRRGSLRGGFLLIGLLSFFLYNSASFAFGAAYNQLFLVYTALLSVSLVAFIKALMLVDYTALPHRILARMPHRGLAAFCLIISPILIMVWLSDLVPVLLQGQAPTLLATYSTMVTYVLDLALIAPSLLIAGLLLLRRNPLGYPLTFSLLTLCTLIGMVVIAQILVQTSLGITLSPGQVIGFVGSFVVMAVLAVCLMVLMLRNLKDRI